ncbi:MAG TPA: HNH endonuclease family protein [Rubrobacteraceae bacterium]|nr:HNH endonuclease family protein [Rubrobacteraceae bacterium]
MKKGAGGLAIVIVAVVVIGYGLFSGQVSVEQVIEGLLGEPSGSGSSQPAGSGPASARGAPAPPPAAEARRQLDELEVAAPGTMAGYSREKFPHWSDAQEFGWDVADSSCDARDAALIRDGEEVSVEEGCDVELGRWVDPYTGSSYTDPADIDIDHMVPLANAWRSGASDWSEAEREAYANDPQVLLSVEDNANQEKGDKGPEAWKPPNRRYHCEYARRWVWIKSDWDLTVNPQEESALRQMLGTCPG